MRSRLIISFVSAFFICSAIEAKTIRLRPNASNSIIRQEMFAQEGVDYKVLGDFNLNGLGIRIPDNSTIYFRRGSFNNGEIHLGNNVVIKGNGSEWRRVRIVADHIKGISISGLRMNGDGASDMHNIFRFLYCSDITMKDIKTYNFYRAYRGKDKEIENDSGFLWYPFLCKDCENILIIGYTSTRTYPEGPFFINCKALTIDDMDVSDVENMSGYDIWTPINAFYCIDVKISNSSFVKRSCATSSGSTANLCCSNMVLSNCHFEGGAGVDFSNEWFNKDFASKDIMIENCSIVKATNGIYTQPTPALVENITMRNSYIQSSATQKVYGFTFATGNIHNLYCSKCYFSGLIFLQFNADKVFDGKIGDCLFEDCSFDDDFYGDYSGPQGPILVRNSSPAVGVGTSTFRGCKFYYDRYVMKLAANAGKSLELVVSNSDFDIKNLDISGDYNRYSLEFVGNRVASKTPSLNLVQEGLGDAVIRDNQFINQRFQIHYTTAPRLIENNTFSGIDGEDPVVVKGASNVTLLNNKSF